MKTAWGILVAHTFNSIIPQYFPFGSHQVLTAPLLLIRNTDNHE